MFWNNLAQCPFGATLGGKMTTVIPARSLELNEEQAGELLSLGPPQAWLARGMISLTDKPVNEVQTEKDWPPRRK